MDNLLRVDLGSSASLLPRGSRLACSLLAPRRDRLGLLAGPTTGSTQQLGGCGVLLGTFGALLDKHEKGVRELTALPLLLLGTPGLERRDARLGDTNLLSESGHDCSFRLMRHRAAGW